MSGEEEGRGVEACEDVAFFAFDHGFELEDVAYEKHLFPAKWLAAVAPEGAKNAVYEINDVSTHHRDFVDDDEFEALKKADVFLAVAQEIADAPPLVAGIVWSEWVEWKLEEAVQRRASCVDGSDTRRCKYDTLLLRVLTYIAKESALARAGLAREEH